MRRLRLGALVVGPVCLAVLILALKGGLHFSPPAGISIPGEEYAVVVHGEQAAFDLDFAPNTRYVAVLGSLGPSGQQFQIGCASHAIATRSLVPSGRVPRLDVNVYDGSEGEGLAPTLHVRGEIGLGSDHLPHAGSSKEPVAERRRTPDSSAVRSFSLHVTNGSLDDPKQYATIHARAVAEGREVRVYLDDQQTPRDLPPGLIQNVMELFDRDVIPRFRDVLGTYRDVDHDGRFAVLLSPWLGRLQAGRTSVGGFVRGSDFQSRVEAPFSNHCDMMYVNSQTLPGPHLRTLLIHEYTHAVCFSRRSADACGRPRFAEEEDWLNEAVAHCAESLFNAGWTNLDYRIARFLNEPESFPLVVDDYYRAGLWRCHGCRGATYLFLRYCLERFGPQALARIIDSPTRGKRNVELATGCAFDRLFRGWTLWMLEAECPPTNSLTAVDLARNVDEVASAAESNTAGETSLAQASLAPLDLYGALGEWGLAGPRRHRWDVDAAALQLGVRGTSAAYVELFASGVAGPRRIRIKAPTDARLQVSVLRLPDDSPRVEALAFWTSEAPSTKTAATQAAAKSPSDRRLQVAVRVPEGIDLMVTQISAEQNAGETRKSICFGCESLAPLEKSSPSADRRLYELPAELFMASDLPVLVKVIVIDHFGRKATAWATIENRGIPTSTERIALGRL